MKFINYMACTFFVGVVATQASAYQSYAQQTNTILFVVMDPGDTKALTPVMQRCDEKNLSYKILTLGNAMNALQGNVHQVDFKKIEQSQPLKAIDWQRETTLTPEELTQIAMLTTPKVVVTGMASKAQAQVANYFKVQHQAKVVAIYDNFDPIQGKDYVQPFLKTLQTVDAFIIPATILRKGFEQLPQAKGAVIKALGQPALEAVDEIFSKTDPIQLKKALGINLKEKIVVFAGGYDGTYAMVDLFVV